jgi:hypothetical protein
MVADDSKIKIRPEIKNKKMARPPPAVCKSPKEA